MTDFFLLWLLVGGIIAALFTTKVAEGGYLTTFEWNLLAVRITLAWPTYIVEEILIRMDSDDEAGP